MNTHKLAISIIREVTLGKREAWDVICLVAEHEPDALCRALGVSIPAGFARSLSNTEVWTRNVLTAIENNNMVGAIKEIRAHRGLGLKEAKDVADKVKAEKGLGRTEADLLDMLARWVPPPVNAQPF